MESEIRKASAADQETLLRLAALCEGAPEWSAAVWEQVLPSAEEESSLRVVLVIATANGIAGFGVIRMFEDTAEIESVGVLPSAKRYGLGTKLCKALLQTAHEAGMHNIQLEVRSRNEAALALYQRLGFAAEGRRHWYYHAPEDDAVLMSLSL